MRRREEESLGRDRDPGDHNGWWLGSDWCFCVKYVTLKDDDRSCWVACPNCFGYGTMPVPLACLKDLR